MLHLSQQQKLLQKLTPQQIQYLKLLQLPTLALEQMIKTELELNPLLEEGNDGETEVEQSAEDTPAVEEEVVIAEEELGYRLARDIGDRVIVERGVP